MWIELAGLPGAGKSWMVEQCRDKISDDLVIVTSRKQGLTGAIKTRLYFPFLFAACGDRSLAHRLAYRLSFRTRANRRTRTFFYDSGIVQVVLENLIQTDFADIQRKTALLSRLPLPDRFIFYDVPPKQALAREIRRTDRCFQGDEPTLLPRYIKAGVWMEKEILPLFRDVYRVSADDQVQFTESLGK